MICFDLLLLPVWSCRFCCCCPFPLNVVPSCAQLLWELTEIDTLRICRMARAVSDKHSSVCAHVTKIQTYTMHMDLW